MGYKMFYNVTRWVAETVNLSYANVFVQLDLHFFKIVVAIST